MAVDEVPDICRRIYSLFNDFEGFIIFLPFKVNLKWTKGKFYIIYFNKSIKAGNFFKLKGGLK